MKFDENLSSLHAYLCGDGYVIGNSEGKGHKYYMIGFRNMNLKLLKDFQKKFNLYFGLKPIITRDKDRCKIGNKKIYYFLTKNYSYYSYEWNLPKLSKKNLKYWLRSFFDCEAWVENQPRKSRFIGLECCNYEGIVSIQNSLERFNINSQIRKKKDRTIWSLTICGLDNLKRFRKQVGFLHPNKNKKLDLAINSYVNYYWDLPDTKNELIRFFKFKGKLKGNYVMFYTIKLVNLAKLKKILNRYRIKSKIGGPWTNNYGSINYSLLINKEVLWTKLNLNLKR